MRYIIGGILVALGALLLLSNANVINLNWMWDFIRTWWPILLILWGLWELVSGGFRFRLWPVILLLLGIGFQLSALGLWEWDFSVVWPVFIVIVGLAILLGHRGRRRSRRREMASGVAVEGASAISAGSGDSWRAVFNSIEEHYPARGFPGGEVVANFGSVSLDLRDATLPEPGAHLDVNLTFGGLHLRVPANWRVDTGQVSAHFGNVQDSRDHSAEAADGGVLTITGTITFGSLEIS
jgi:predicted membrane protein